MIAAGYWKILVPEQNQNRRIVQPSALEQQLISKIIELPADNGDPLDSTTCLRKKFQCPKCPKIFSNKSSVIQHMRYDCNRKPRFACPYCEQRSK